MMMLRAAKIPGKLRFSLFFRRLCRSNESFRIRLNKCAVRVVERINFRMVDVALFVALPLLLNSLETRFSGDDLCGRMLENQRVERVATSRLVFLCLNRQF